MTFAFHEKVHLRLSGGVVLAQKFELNDDDNDKELLHGDFENTGYITVKLCVPFSQDFSGKRRGEAGLDWTEGPLHTFGFWKPQLISRKRYKMLEKRLVQAEGMAVRLLSVFMVFMFGVSLAGCVAAIPIAVKMVKEKDMAKLTLEVEGNAEEIFDASVRTTKRKNPDMEVIKEDREDLEFEAKKMTPEGKELWASWEVEQKDKNMVEVKFKVKGEDMEEEVVEQRARRGIDDFCKEIGKKCNIEE